MKNIKILWEKQYTNYIIKNNEILLLKVYIRWIFINICRLPKKLHSH